MAEAEMEYLENQHHRSHSNPDFKSISLWGQIEESCFRLKDIKIFQSENGRHHSVIEIPNKGVWYESIYADSQSELLESLLKNIKALDNGLHIDERAVIGIHFSLESFLDEHGLSFDSMIQIVA